MSYFKYLKSKSKLLVIYFLINGFALFVNFFQLDGQIINEYVSENKRSRVCLFTCSHEKYESNFWPFQSFYSTSTYPESDIDGTGYIAVNYFVFYGIFQNYDHSEFIAYSILIFAILYFMYESQSKKDNLS